MDTGGYAQWFRASTPYISAHRNRTFVVLLSGEAIDLLQTWPERKAGITSEQYSYTVRGREITGNNYRTSLSHQKIPKIAAPRYEDWGTLLLFLQKKFVKRNGIVRPIY